jgi:glycosyltransferase involved in cell wall biosynthesis
VIAETGWPCVYDVTDDWLLAPFPERELSRLRALDRLALVGAKEVVVCSPSLAATRGRERDVTLIPNGVDVDHFREPRTRPPDLPPSPVAVYVGSLHDARLDAELVAAVARHDPELSVVLIGPDSLDRSSRRMLQASANVRLLGTRPYADIPGYLQHADVILVPHRITPFTESLDPIKAYECLAVETPTVATAVAGFREHADAITVVPAHSFPAAVRRARSTRKRARENDIVRTWDESAGEFVGVLERACR